MKVLKKQYNSKMCIICGMNNEAGLKAPFYEMENNTVVTIVTFRQIHQSYPERTHGGMISTLLDEIIGRAIWIEEPTSWGVTMDIHVKFRKPVPLDTQVMAYGKITRNTSKFFTGVGAIMTLDGEILAEGTANYIKLKTNQIATTDIHDDVNVYVEDNVTEINI